MGGADRTMTETTEAVPSDKQIPKPWAPPIVGWVLLIGALAAAFGHNFVEMWHRWFPAWKQADMSLYDRFMEGESYYTHGPLIPVVSLVIAVLLVRHVKIPLKPNRKHGGIVLGGSILFHLVACLARVNFASAYALIGVLAGLVLWFWGTKALRRLWFPIALLVFMVPLPEVTIYQLNFKLKMYASQWGVGLANLVGVIAERSGNRVFLEGDKSLVIANVCNGLRTLISLLAFGALYCYVCRLRGLWRWGLFALTIPVAVVSNSVRIVGLIVVADIWTPEIATGAYHDWSGIFIFVLAFLLMFGIERLILWARDAAGRPAEVVPLFHGSTLEPGADPQWPPMSRALGQKPAIAAGVAMVLVALGAWWLGRPAENRMTDKVLANVVPHTMEVNGKRMSSVAEVMDTKTLTILENPSYFYRRYSAPDGRKIEYCLIFSKDNRKGTHPPDVCLAGSGEGIVEKAPVAMGGVKGRGTIPCREIVVQTGQTKQYFLYTYKCGNRYTASFWWQQLLIFGNGVLDRNASGALIRVSTIADEGVSEARGRCMALLRASVPHLDKNLP